MPEAARILRGMTDAVGRLKTALALRPVCDSVGTECLLAGMGGLVGRANNGYN